MTKQDKRGEGTLTPSAAAAAALEQELERFEELSATARRTPLDSQKNLEKAARAARDAAESQARFAAHVRTLVEQIGRARDRQQASADALNTRVEAINARAAEVNALFEQYGALGVEAKEINLLVVQLASAKREAKTDEETTQIIARLDEIQARMGLVVDKAQELSKTAASKGLDDLARQADGLRQQLGAAKNKLNLFRQSLAATLGRLN